MIFMFAYAIYQCLPHSRNAYWAIFSSGLWTTGLQSGLCEEQLGSSAEAHTRSERPFRAGNVSCWQNAFQCAEARKLLPASYPGFKGRFFSAGLTTRLTLPSARAVCWYKGAACLVSLQHLRA